MNKNYGTEYLDVKEVCQLLKISQSTLRAWRRDNKIKYVKVSERKCLFPATEVTRILTEGCDGL